MSNYYVERARYSCALNGATATVTALPRAIPIMHSGSGCAGNISWTQQGACGLQVGGYCGGLSIPSSCVGETEVVFGGGGRLKEEITHTLDVMDGDLYVVLTSCVTDMIGDDIHSVVSEFRERGVEIIYAETGGFKGDSYLGYDLVLQSLFKNYLTKGLEKIPGKVNLWGIVPSMDVFWRGNLENAAKLLEKLGLQVNTFFTSGDSLKAIKESGSAQLNIVLSNLYGVEAARVFEEVHQVPYLTLPLPIGPHASDHFLRLVGAKLDLAAELVEQVIAEENYHYYQVLSTLTDSYNDADLQRYAIVVGDANYAPSLTRFLADDLGWLPELVAVTDILRPKQQELVRQSLAGLESGLEPLLVFETDSSEIITHLNKNRPQFTGKRYQNTLSPACVVGSSSDRDLAAKLGAAHLSVTFPVLNRAVLRRGYTGYDGGLTLIEDLLSVVVAGR